MNLFNQWSQFKTIEGKINPSRKDKYSCLLKGQSGFISLPYIIISMRALNWLMKRVVKVRLEGPIDMQIEQKIMHQLGKITPRNSQALVLIINSYGGSLRVAKNIAQTLKQLQSNQVPVYCFAEEFCLNSANLILTSSTQCFANKLSIIGDFGYVYENYSIEQFSERFNVGLQKISLQSTPIDTFANSYQLNNPILVNKLLQQSAEELREHIVQNRREKLRIKGIAASQFEEQVLKGGSLVPSEAVKAGFIDGLQTCEHFISCNLSGYRVKEEKEYKQYRAINFLRNSLEVFKQE